MKMLNQDPVPRLFHEGLTRLLIALIIGISVIGTWLISVPDARAHGYIIRSMPQSRGVLDRAPARIQAWFSEGLEARFSTLTLKDQDGKEILLADVGVNPDNTSILSARIPEPLPNGAYLINMRAAFASDGHVYNEVLVFWVGEPTGQGDSAFADADQTTRTADPLEVLWRAITLPGLNVLFGALVLYQVILLPGWGNRKYRAGGLAPRLMRALNLTIWIAIGAALIGTIIAVLQQSMALFYAAPEQVIRERLWSVVLEGTQVGGMLKLRLVFIGFAALCHAAITYFMPRYPDAVAPVMAVNILNGAAALFTLSMTSHAAGATLWTIPSALIDWVHLLANSAWIGGLFMLSILLPIAVAPYQAANQNGSAHRPEAQLATRAILRRFSALGVICVLLLITTGVYSSLVHVLQLTDLTGTAYGLSLIAKTLLILPLLGLALYHHLITDPSRLRSIQDRLRLQMRMPTLFRTLRVESLIGLIVLISAAYLSATPPPIPVDARAASIVPTLQATIDGLAVQLAVDPNAAGENSYEAILTRDGNPVEGATVRLQWAYPALDQRTDPIRLEDSGGGSYLSGGAELVRGGGWRAILDITEAGSAAPIRAAFAWDVLSEAPPTNPRTANWLNWLSAAAILGILGAWLIPPSARGVGSLRWKRETILIATVSSLIAVVLLGGGVVLIANSSTRIEALRNPAPEVVNPTLPDSESLIRGQSVFERECLTCHAPGSNTPLRQSRIDFLRDEELYTIIVHGQDNIPAVPLTDAERWDVINYLRR